MPAGVLVLLVLAIALAEPAAGIESTGAVQDTKQETDTVLSNKEKEKQGRLIRVHMLDGSIIVGELQGEEIEVRTPFGVLKIPTGKLKGITPGLDSQTQRGKQIYGLFDQLGSIDFKTRQAASKDLIKLGLPIRPLLREVLIDADLDKKTRIKTIMKAFEEEEEGLADGEDPEANALCREDIVETPTFAVRGRIACKTLSLRTSFGVLKLGLEKIRRVHRDPKNTEERKVIAVTGTHLTLLRFKNCRIRVARGDTISVKASGSITMTPWGNNRTSTPTGAMNCGWYIPNKTMNGALMAKIGSNGKAVVIGTEKTFIADRPGPLQFAIAMQSSYLNYSFPGEYNVRIKVTRKPPE